MKNKALLQWLGLLGVISFASYLAAVIFSPFAYPGYDWLSQAVSDLSADSSPSLSLWKILSTPYSSFNLAAVIVGCIVIQKTNKNRILKIGVYLFALMNIISALGYGMFPLSNSGMNHSFQDTMHIIVTILVVVLSIASLLFIIIGGARKNGDKFLFISALVSLSCMMIGAIGTGLAPKNVFGLFERFSTLSATAYVAALGIWVFNSQIDNN